MSELETLYREEAGRVRATLIRLLGDFDRAEEALHDAFLAAAEQWPRQGRPANPRSWLISAGRFKAIDAMRRRARLDRVRAALAAEGEPVVEEAGPVEDDALRLIFVCCHPALPADAQVALCLREVCGLTTEAIAAAYLARPPTIAQRIVRAKARLRELAVPFDLPPPAERPARADAVLEVIYLVFSEGYAASGGDGLMRQDLSAEAIRLARLVRETDPSADVDGLLGLMLLQDSRRAARLSGDGGIVLLPDQDRTVWDAGAIAEGLRLVAGAMARPPLGGFTLQGAIAAVHARAASAAATDWGEIVRLYGLLARADPGPVVELNWAVAVAMRDGPAAGLARIEALMAGDALADYRYAHMARADLLRRLERAAEAREAYGRALALPLPPEERRFVEARVAELGQASV